MKLYYFPLSTYSQKALMAFHEKKIPFEPEIVDLRDDAARAESRKLYPLGKVPLLVLDDGHLIPESSILIEYQPAFLTSPRLRARICPHLRRCARQECSTCWRVPLRALALARLVATGISTPSLRAPVSNAG